MRRIVLVMVGVWVCVAGRQGFSPAEVSSAGDAYAPFNVALNGLFVVDVRVGDDGGIRGIEVLRNPGGMLDVVKSAIQSWKFQAAVEGGKARASCMTVAFVYRPANYVGFGATPVKDFTPVIPPEQAGDDGEDCAPVGIVSFAYADYPVNSVSSGSVVLQATVDSAGAVKNVTALHEMANFNRFAREALRNWRFRAATRHGRPVTSKIAVAFIFQPPPSGE